MNKGTLIKALIIILAVLLFFGVLLLALIPLQRKPQVEEAINPKPSFRPTPGSYRTGLPAATPPAPVTQTRPTQLTEKELIGITPVIETGFKVEYLLEQSSFLVTITESPYAENKQKAQDWFKGHGLEINSLKVLWSSYRYVN